MTGEPEKCPAEMLRSFRKLRQKKYRRSEGAFLVEGVRAVEELLESRWDIEALLVCGDDPAPGTSVLPDRKGVRVWRITPREMEALTETVTPQGVIAVVRIPPAPDAAGLIPAAGPALILALDSVADPGNAGTMIRTADWFGASGIVLDRGTVELFNPKVIRSAMGSVFHLPIAADADLPGFLKSAKARGCSVVATTLNGGKEPGSFRFPERCVCVLGSEAHGISPEAASLADLLVTIPRYGNAESLNVAVAAGILLAHARRNG